MARCRCRVRFGSFRWSRKDYAAVMDSPEVQALVRKSAQAIANRLTAGYERPAGEIGTPYVVKPIKGRLARGYVVKPVKGRLARGYIVGTGTHGAMLRELKENAMKKEIDGGGA